MTQTPILPGYARGAIILVYLMNPREKVWGVLMDLTPAGVWIRGLDLHSFDDWLRSLGAPEDQRLHPSTCFYPLVRVEKVLLDEPADGSASLQAQCLARTGRSLGEQLGAGELAS
ncbi:MAG TPA: hypothetical protein VGK94_10455 [Candidatus Polarisedimenticolia bacterium]|jgi:hypothetical protein